MMTRTESGRQIQIAIAQREARSGEPSSLFRAAQRLSTLDLYDKAANLLEDVIEEQPRNMRPGTSSSGSIACGGTRSGLGALA